jgi:hypothetical protein
MKNKKQKFKFTIRQCESEFPRGRNWEVEEETFQRVSISMKIVMFDETRMIGFTMKEAEAITKALNDLYK